MNLITKSLILTIAVFVTHSLSGFIEDMVVKNVNFAWIYLFGFYAFGLYLTLMWVDKK